MFRGIDRGRRIHLFFNARKAFYRITYLDHIDNKKREKHFTDKVKKSAKTKQTNF